MRILQLIQKNQPRGAETFALQLSAHLRDHGHQVQTVSLFFHPSPETYSQHLSLNRPHYLRLIDLMGWYKLSSIINQFKPDIIQANAADTLKFSVFSKLLFQWNKPIIYRNANLMSHFAPKGIKNIFNRWLLQQSNHIISVSEVCSTDLNTNFGLHPSKISTIEIGVEESNFEFLPAKEETATDKNPYLIHIGSFVAEKNHFGLLRIFSIVLQQFPTVKLVLVGEGPLQQHVLTYATQLGLSEKIEFAGAVKNVYPLLQKASVLLLPSLIEGIPAVLLEAMYCGCPVMAFRVGGIPDLIIHEENGFLFKPAAENEMAAAAVDILANKKPEKVTTIRKKAHQLIKDQFLNSQIAVRFEDVYLKLLRQTVVHANLP